VDEVLAAVSDPKAGGVCVFVGTIRSDDGGRDVESLSYSAHPSATQALTDVCSQVAGRHDVMALAAVHRIGDLVVGDLATVVGASAVHRAEAFAAAQDLIDTLKASVPIWKHQRFAGGEAEWVGLP
jgi:molybdopterin synthase catalytic subunit